MSQTLDTRHLDLSCAPDFEAEQGLREAIAACCDREIMATAMISMHSALLSPADLAWNLLPMLTRLRDHGGPDLASVIIHRFLDTPDRSRFGVSNVVTELAREMPDPEVRWRLEEFGGEIAVGAMPKASEDNYLRRRLVPG